MNIRKFAGMIVATAVALTSLPLVGPMAAPLMPLPTVSKSSATPPSDLVQVASKRKIRVIRGKRRVIVKRVPRHYHSHRRYYPGPFIGGVVLGTIIANQTPRVVYRHGVSNAHLSYCYSRYRSYRAWDNSFQPYHGPRRACRSPYWP